MPASTPTRALLEPRLLRRSAPSCAGLIYIAFYRSFNPTAGQFRELDGIASVIIGGGSIFGGYGTIIGSLAGAAVITLVRALLSLQIIARRRSSFVMPQHWVNVFIGTHPDRRGAQRHLGAPGQHLRALVRRPPCAPADPAEAAAESRA